MLKVFRVLRRRHKSIRLGLIWFAEFLVFASAGITAFLLRFDTDIPIQYRIAMAYALPVWIVVKIVIFHLAKLDRGWSQYLPLADVWRIAVANLVGSFVSCVVIVLIAHAGFPRSIYVLDLLICFLATTGLRVLVRMISYATINSNRGIVSAKRALIYGAGSAGLILFKEVRTNPRLAYRVVGFLDDQEDKKGLELAGIPVFGTGDSVSAIVKRHEIEVILIAIPSANGHQMVRILRLCHEAGVICKTLPGIAELIEGTNGLAGHIRDVAVEDLLGRQQVSLDERQIRQKLEGKVILVTGAAGSIGSELCRQIARFHPASIVGFEIAESPLFEIDREIRQTFPGIPFHPEIGTIQDRARLDEVFSKYKPQVVYHAAAYKHVPLMETHVFEAIRNNIFGTHNVAQTASAHGVEQFVLISSDKAVRPTNVMGATKRIAELVLSGMERSGTKYVAVRFGNVLGSNGSVIPIFKKQIAAGGPVTVTHPEMCRFFMTIPEACQLVLQASAIGKSGQICVLDMGEPVKIVDLAKNLILLSGLRLDEQIKIEFSGIRPGEKLYEELSLLTEDTVPTEHEKIRIFSGVGLSGEDVEDLLELLRDICKTSDVGRLIVALKEVVLDYSPSTHLLKRAFSSRDRELIAFSASHKVSLLQAKSSA